MLTSLLYFLLLVAAFIVVPLLAGIGLCRLLRASEYGPKLGFVLVTIALGLSPFLPAVKGSIWPGSEGTKAWKDVLDYGIDLAGGTNLVYEVVDDPAKGPATSTEMNNLVTAITRRINPAGTKEVVVRIVGQNRIEVIIPGADPGKVADTKALITRLGTLEFAIVANQGFGGHANIIEQARQTKEDNVVLGGQTLAKWCDIRRKGGDSSRHDRFDDPRIYVTREKPGDTEGTRQLLLVVDPDESHRVTGRHLTLAQADRDRDGNPCVRFVLNAEGGYWFRELTSQHLSTQERGYHYLAILLDEKVETAPRIMDTIHTEGQITGDYTEKEVQELVGVLNAGSLPRELKKEPISEFTISPTLGLDVQTKGFRALWVATAAVILFMAVYYLIAGLIADFAMILNLFFIVSAMAMLHAAFTLPGLAGLVLSAGMAVDANVLIYERIREELQRGASLRMAIHNGFDRALTAIIDSNLTTLITAVILYGIGTDQVKGFAIALFIGLVVNLFTAVFVSRLILNILERGRWIDSLKMMSWVGVSNIDFVGKQYIATVASVVVIGIGMLALVARGQDNLDIDFTGGTMVSMVFNEPQDTEAVRKGLEKQGLGTNIALEKLSSPDDAGLGDQGRRFRVRTTVQGVVNDPDNPQVQIPATKFVEQRINQAFGDKLLKVKLSHGDLEPIPVAAKKDDESTKSESDKKDPAIESKFAGGHRVTLELSSHLGVQGVQRDLIEQLSAIPGSEGNKKYDRAEALLSLVGEESTRKPDSQPPVYQTMTLEVSQLVAADDVSAVLKAIQERMANLPVFEETTSFERSVASEAQVWAVIAILLSLIAIVAYVWFRFDQIVFGLAAVVALAHDVLVALGSVAVAAYLSKTPIGPLFLLTDFKIDMSMIAAFLTIVGYSLNDTIVIFDRLREVRGKNPQITKEMINLTLNQTLSRTLLTALTVLLSVLILYVLGGESIHGFAFCMVIGGIAGTYSTIYIASPLVLWFMDRSNGVTAKAPSAASKPQPASAV